MKTNTNDHISRQAAIDAMEESKTIYHDRKVIIGKMQDIVNNLPSVPKWIPVKVRPMTEEERWNFEEHFGYQLDDDDAVYFDCKMPEDRQRIWVTTKCGYVFDDVCDSDDGYIGLEGNGDWFDITAWMPMFIPEPYKERTDETD